MFTLNFNPLKSRTFWGAVLLLSTPIVHALVTGDPVTGGMIQEFVGGLLVALGLRSAVGGPTAASK